MIHTKTMVNIKAKTSALSLFLLGFMTQHSFATADQPIKRRNAIVIGASSGMGREVAKLLSKEGYTLGLVARRLPLLKSLQAELQGITHIKAIDVTDPQARDNLSSLIATMGGLDLIVISISSYLDNRKTPADLDNRNTLADHDNKKNDNKNFPVLPKTWPEIERTLDVDLKGFIAMADVALRFFSEQNHGHLVGISSTSGLRGSAASPEYCAAKACISRYMEGMRNFMDQNNKDVLITDVIPGFVAVEHSPLGEDPSAYWEITVEEAGKTIIEGIKAEKKVIYVPSKVRLIAYLHSILPDWLYNSCFSWL